MVEAQLEMGPLGRMGGQVSGRAVRRHAAARRPRPEAFATGSDILLMDEPFSRARSVDPQPPAGRVAGVAAPAEEDHPVRQPRPRRSAEDGNRIVIMEGGRIVQVGRPEQIVTRPASEYVANFCRQRQSAQRTARPNPDGHARHAAGRSRTAGGSRTGSFWFGWNERGRPARVGWNLTGRSADRSTMAGRRRRDPAIGRRAPAEIRCAR